jgi:hypothetical protein
MNETPTTLAAERLVVRFIAVWNETDAEARRRAVESLWTADGVHLMGANQAFGWDALEARVKASHERSVVEGKNVFRSADAIQTLPGVIKFRWDMARRESGEIAAGGVGFLMVDDAGRIACDYLFTES